MNRRIVLISGIAVIFILILSFIFSQPGILGPTSNNNIPTIQQSSIQPTRRIPESETYQEFVRSGRSEVCTFSTSLKGGSNNGTVYAASGKIRTDFTITGPKGTLQQHFLIDSYTAYLWNNLSKNGVKFPVTETGANERFANLLNLNCSEWVPNFAIFDLPSDVVFTEVTDKDIDTLRQFAPTSAPTGQ